MSMLCYFFAPVAHLETFRKIAAYFDKGEELNFKRFPLHEVLFGCCKTPKNFNLNPKNKAITCFFYVKLPIT